MCVFFSSKLNFHVPKLKKKLHETKSNFSLDSLQGICICMFLLPDYASLWSGLLRTVREIEFEVLQVAFISRFDQLSSTTGLKLKIIVEYLVKWNCEPPASPIGWFTLRTNRLYIYMIFSFKPLLDKKWSKKCEKRSFSISILCHERFARVSPLAAKTCKKHLRTKPKVSFHIM